MRQHLFSTKFFPSLDVRGETFEHTTFEVSFLKNKFNNMFFSFTRNRKAVNFILRKEEGKESPYKILSLLHPQQKLQGTAKEKYQFSKCVKQIIKVSAPNDCKKKKSQFFFKFTYDSHTHRDREAETQAGSMHREPDV